MRRPLKALVAVAAGLALLVLSAVPSAATGNVTAGTLGISLTPAISTPLTGSTDPSCRAQVTYSFPSSLWFGHVTMDFVVPFTYGGGNYILEFHHSSANMSVSGGTVAVSSFALTDINIYVATGLGSCTRSSPTPKCTNIDVSFPVVAFTGTFNGLISTWGTQHSFFGGVFNLNSGTGQISASSCTAPFSALNTNTKTLAISGMTFV